MNGPPNPCGCCAGLTALTPAEVQNRPGLSAIAYRVGSHALFKQSLLAALSDARRPALPGLKTRDDDDFSIALLDAAAMLADVLTFYQERIANESYLRTATERRSLLELARLIGYRPRPGVAANAVLAFTLDDAQGAPRRAALDVGVKVQSVPGPDEKPQTFETVEQIEARVEWNALKPQMSQFVLPSFGSTHVWLNGTDTNLKPGDALLFVGSEREADPGSERWDFRRVKAVTPDHEAGRTLVEWEEPLGSTSPYVLPAAQPKVYALRLRASLFGYNALHPATLSNDTLTHYGQSPSTDWAFSITGQQTIDLDAAYPAVLPKSWLVLSRPDYQELYRAMTVVEGSRAAFTLSGKTTRISLDTNENLLGFAGSNYRSTVVFAQSELLQIAEEPLTSPITGATIPLVAPVEGLTKDQLLVASGKDSTTGETISEVVRLADISGATLTLSPPLAKSYARDSFRLNANIARATHGETVQEALGSGDASQPYQKFNLRQSPLTYTSAPTPSGGETTLQVRVNDVLWQEVATLFGRGPQEHVYLTRTDDDGKTTVEFGDGVTGARLPSGQDNLRAKYRKGIGVEGLVKAGQLTLLMAHPLGVKAVINPEDAADAKDPDSLADARRNAPLTVLTLDRTVSLQDYEDFARAFGAVAKALATWAWDGQKRSVFVTVASPNGAPITETSKTYEDLLEAMSKAGDPLVSLRVKSYRPAPFRLAGKIKPEADRLPDKVLAAVQEALQAQFSFDARNFGQPVMLSEVIAAIQNVPGVVAVDLDKLYRAGQTADLQNRLLAALPEPGPNGEMLGAELLTLDPASLEQLGTMP